MYTSIAIDTPSASLKTSSIGWGTVLDAVRVDIANFHVQASPQVFVIYPPPGWSPAFAHPIYILGPLGSIPVAGDILCLFISVTEKYYPFEKLSVSCSNQNTHTLSRSIGGFTTLLEGGKMLEQSKISEAGSRIRLNPLYECLHLPLSCL